MRKSLLCRDIMLCPIEFNIKSVTLNDFQRLTALFATYFPLLQMKRCGIHKDEGI